jgi:CheY-like chemotaxis protein
MASEDMAPEDMASEPTPRILAVEDNTETRLLLQHLLKENFEATIVPHVDAAMDAAANAQEEGVAFDALLLDVNLSDRYTGTDLLHMLRDQYDMEDVPAIAMTAYAMPGDREGFLNSGFNHYVSKPFTRADLLGTIREALGTHPA